MDKRKRNTLFLGKHRGMSIFYFPVDNISKIRRFFKSFVDPLLSLANFSVHYKHVDRLRQLSA